MDVWTIIRTTARRWYVSVPIIAICLGAGYLLAKDLPPVYTAQTTAILTGPAVVEGQEEGEVEEVNPFLSLGGALTTTTQAMVVLMDSPSKRLEYEALGLLPDYVVDRADAVLVFEVEGDDPDEVAATAQELVKIADTELAELQGEAAAPPPERIRVVPLAVPELAAESGGAGAQLMAVLGGLGLVTGIGAAIAFEGLQRLRLARRAARDAATPPAPAPAPPADLPPTVDAPGSQPTPPEDAPRAAPRAAAPRQHQAPPVAMGRIGPLAAAAAARSDGPTERAAAERAANTPR